MAPRAPRVYSADIDGVHEWIVAAANQRAALDALGVHQDLFAQDRAKVEKDPLKVEAAREQPGVALRRAKGSRDDFVPVSADGGGAWEAALQAAPALKRAVKTKPPHKATTPPPARAASAVASKAQPSKPAPRAPPKLARPDRTPVREAEAALKAFEREAARTLSALDDERAALERRERQARLRIDRQREALTRVLNRARSAYEAAGGRG